jgi:integrase
MAVWVREWDGGKRGGGKKAWWVFIKHEGKRKARRIGPGPEGRRAAMLVAEQLRAKIALREFNLNDEPRLTLAAFAARWLDGHVEHNLRPTTAPKYREVMRKHWLPRLGSMALRVITRAHVQQLQRDYQNNTIRWFLNVLQSCLAAAVADAHLADNPALHSTKGLWRGNAGRNRDIDVFTKPEIMALLRRAEAIAPMTHMMVLTLARSGLRISELLGLRVEDLDFERREIHVRRTWGNHSLYGHAIRTWGKDAVGRLDDVGLSEVKSGTSTSGKGLWIVKGGGS